MARRNHNTAPKPFYRKIGGLHFLCFWRIRVSFCVVKSTPTKEPNYGRIFIHERYLAG